VSAPVYFRVARFYTLEGLVGVFAIELGRVMGVVKGRFATFIGGMMTSMLLAGASPAAADSGSVQVAVLNMEGRDIDDGLLRTLTSVLRHEAQQHEQYALVNPAPVNLNEIVLVLRCDPEAAACLREAASYLDARVLIYGSVVRRGAGYEYNVEIFDASTSTVLRQLRRTVRSGDDPVVAFRREVEALFASRDVIPASRLQIGAPVEGARVRIDGLFVGTTPYERLGLDPGRYRLDVSADGYGSWSVIVEIVEGSDLRLWAPLEAGEAAAAPAVEPEPAVMDAAVEPPAMVERATGPRPRDPATGEVESPRARSNWGAWSTMGVGVVALGTSGAMVVMMRDVEREVTDLVASGRPRAELETDYDALVARGERYEAAHQVLLGVGALTFTGGTVWLLVRQGQQRRARAGIIDWSVGPGSVGATVRF
jgi:hypothetical protein